MYCPYTFYQMAATDILDALRESQCQLATSRYCDKPDALVCEFGFQNIRHKLYPLQLLCLDQPFTKQILSRYNRGPSGMEIISRHGNCLHLRFTRRTRYAVSEKGKFKPQVNLELTIRPGDGTRIYEFWNRGWGLLRCTDGHSRDGWSCSMYDCFDRRLTDGESNICYRPDRVTVDIFGTDDDRFRSAIPQQPVGGGEGVVVNLCVCLKIQIVLSSVGWWRVWWDTLFAIAGHCSLKLYNTLAAKSFLKTTEDEGWSSKRRTDIEFNRENADAILDKDDLNRFRSFSKRLRQLWTSDERCTDEDYGQILLCFFNSKITSLNATCLNLQKSAINFKPNFDRVGENVSDTAACVFVRCANWFLFLLVGVWSVLS